VTLEAAPFLAAGRGPAGGEKLPPIALAALARVHPLFVIM